MAKLFDTLHERVLAKVVKPDDQNENGCWIYAGRVDKDGYGRLNLRVPNGDGPKRHVTKRVHLVIWESVNGPLEPGATLDHLDCVSKACCNPDHLEPTTRAENSKRRVERRPYRAEGGRFARA